MEQKPTVKLSLSSADKIAEVLCLLLLICMWLFAVYCYYTSPRIIPIHFNASAKPDNYGGKAALFLLPGIVTFLFLFLTLLNRLPAIYNYSVNITQENALPFYTNATRMVRYLKLSLIAVFWIIILSVYLAAKGVAEELQKWTLPVILVLIFLPTVYFVIKSFRVKNRKILL